MKVFLDTNVVLDYLTGRDPFADDAEAVIEICTHAEHVGVMTTLSACNIIYVLTKIIGRKMAEVHLAELLELISVVGVEPDSVITNVNQSHPDFEDAVQLSEAVRCGADVIVTRDPSGFAQSEIPICSPSEFLSKFAH